MHSSVRPVLVVVLVSLFASCNHVTAPTTVAEAKTLWQSQNLSSYSYTASHACYCVLENSGPVTVDVAQGRVTRVIALATGAEIPASGWYTIDELFDQLLFTEGQVPSVQFDARLGYPRRIERCCMANDSGSIYTASGLFPTN
jgi:uncharacterized protein DUF6174